MPVMMSETMSGITVIRIAFTHREPIGAAPSATRSASPFPLAAMAAPMQMAARSAMSTRVPSFMRTVSCYIIKSPPLMSNDAPVM
jgi:hypothetical protein